MTRATIQVQIPRPCSAAWEAMTPTAQGRHCAACQLTVTDFTQRTDAEVLALLRQAAGGRVCGRFRAEQLNRELVHAPVAAPRWRAWLLAAATLLGLPAVASAQALRNTHPGGPLPAEGNRAATQQLPAAAVTDQVTTASEPTDEMIGKVAIKTLPIRVSGRVVDQVTGEGIPGATVVLKGTKEGTSTNADGSFALDVSSARTALTISFVGYVDVDLEVNAALNQPLTVALTNDIKGQTEVVFMGAIEYPWYSPRGLWYRVRSLPQRLTGRW